MRDRSGILLVGLLAVSLSLPCHADKKENAAGLGRPLLQSAAERSFLPLDGKSAVGVKLSFRLIEPQFKGMAGTYSLLVNDKGDWRREVVLPDYTDVVVGRGKSVWAKRSLDFKPRPVEWLDSIFRSFQFLDPSTGLDRYFTNSEHHLKLRCLELHQAMVRAVCFDPNNNLVRAQITGDQTYEYSGYRPIGEKFLFHQVAVKTADKTLLGGTIEIVTSDQNPAVWATPSGAIERPGCLNPTVPVLIMKTVPDYPRNERQALQEGLVTVYALIASDGSVRNLRVLQSAGKGFDDATLQAVSSWQYAPAKCGDVPVDYETEFTVSYTLRR